MARPTKFKDDYVKLARKLVLFGATDEQMASFFEVSLVELAEWAMDNPEFLVAITPTDREIAIYLDRMNGLKKRRNEWRKSYMAQNVSERVRSATASRLWAAIKGRSDGKLFSRLGYSVDELMAHLEVKFLDGMSWKNYGKWHIDHIRPCASYDLTDPEQFAECWGLSNLQPLWARDNIRKGAKYASA